MTSKFDVVSIGSAVVDTIFKSSQFTPHKLDGELMLCEIYGGKADVEAAVLTSGGAGTNTAVGFARQGLLSSVVAEIGQDMCAQIVIDELLSEHVDTSLLIQESSEQTGMSAVLVASDGSRSAVTFRGAAKMLTPSDIPFSELKNVPWIHLSSIGNPELIRQIFLFCKENSIHLSWNPGKTEIVDIVNLSVGDFSDCVDILFLNDLEYAAVEQKKDFLHELAKTLIVTRGKDGGEVWVGKNRTTYEGKTVEAECELGAGDAFASGVVGAFIQNKSLEVALDWGVQNGASVVKQMGAKKGLLSFS